MVPKYLGSLKPVIMSNKNTTIIPIAAQLFGKEYHNHYPCHLTNNLLKEVAKHGV